MADNTLPKVAETALPVAAMENVTHLRVVSTDNSEKLPKSDLTIAGTKVTVAVDGLSGTVDGAFEDVLMAIAEKADTTQVEALDEEKLDITNVYNALDKTVEGFALDARQGKALEDKKIDKTAVKQVVGTSETDVMSQKSLTGGLFSIAGAVRYNGVVSSSSAGIVATPYLPIDREKDLRVYFGYSNVSSGQTPTSNSIVPYAFYDIGKNFISAYSGTQITELPKIYECLSANIPSNAAYVRCTTYNLYTGYEERIDGVSLNLGGIYDEINTALQVRRSSLPSCDLNNVRSNGMWLISESYTYQNTPATIGFLRVGTASTWTIQEFWALSTATLYKRRSMVNKTWDAWAAVGGNYTNNYEFNSYEAINNINSTPSITTDTNNYLVSSGDATDRTADILTLLSTTGICNLGPGPFYVQDLVMPVGTTLVGSGTATEVILASGGTFAIKMGSYCGVKGMVICGNTTNISLNASSTKGTRSGLLWQGNYTESPNSTLQPYRSMVENVWIRSFDNGGITCYDTGYGTSNNLNVSNVHVWNCYAGINIEYWSEYHKFTNVRAGDCCFGCINNGGNNQFANCDFSGNFINGFLMDNSQGQSPNNSHGSCVGVIFNHTANNEGVGIKILGCDYGFIFSGCQIHYSQIHIEDSDGIVFANTNLGSTNCDITIINGGCVLFSNNMHKAAPVLSITNNNNVRFANCYIRDTGEEVGN